MASQNLRSTVARAGSPWWRTSILIVGWQLLQQPRAWLAVFCWIFRTDADRYGERKAWTVCALDCFFLCLLHMQRWHRSRRSDLSISSRLKVAGAIMGNGQGKKKTFNTRVLLASVLFTDCPCTLKVAAPLIGAGVCQKQLKQLTECLNAYFSDYI